MSKKHTIGFIREQFEKEGYTLLSKEYINAHSKLEYICQKNHRAAIKWNDWQQGHRCPECYGNKILTIGFVRKQFKKEGYTLLTKEYKGCAQKLRYVCPKGHCWSITWNDWRYGYRCCVCGIVKRSNKQRLPIEFVKKELKKENYTLLTKKYINNEQKLKCICSRGHTCYITWGSWNNKQRCKECYLENNKGSNHPNWNSNLTQKDRINGRHIFGYKEWLYLVKERDNFTCQVCGDNRGGNLVSHHLESYNNNPELRTKLDNGICLCKTCHKDFHHQYGYGNNARRQFEEFISARRL